MMKTRPSFPQILATVCILTALSILGTCISQETDSPWRIERVSAKEDQKETSSSSTSQQESSSTPSTDSTESRQTQPERQETESVSEPDKVSTDSLGWHRNIVATYFDIAAYPTQQTAWNDVDPLGEENPYYLALPFNNQVPGYRDYGPCKNRWVELVEVRSGTRAFGQWEDVGPWFVNDVQYVFDESGATRPFAEENVGEKWNIYRETRGEGVRRPRKILNKAGIDLSPLLIQALGIDGKGRVHWRFVEADAVEPGPWKEKISTTPPHYRKAFYFYLGERYRPWELTTTRFKR